MSEKYQRAWVLYYELKRYDLAERELRGALAESPDHALAHSLLALCLLQRGHLGEARREVEAAIQAEPNLAFAHYVRSRLQGACNKVRAAIAAIEEAIRLEPMNADFFSRLASLRYDSGRWTAALKAAEDGLAIEAQNVGCTNLRALALAKLGRKREAHSTSSAALARDPENAITHAIQGTTLMRQAEYAQARACFMEALRLDPMCDWAHRGRKYARDGAVMTAVPTTVGRWVCEAFARLRRSRIGPLGAVKQGRIGSATMLFLAALAWLPAHESGVVAIFVGLFGTIPLAMVWISEALHSWLGESRKKTYGLTTALWWLVGLVRFSFLVMAILCLGGFVLGSLISLLDSNHPPRPEFVVAVVLTAGSSILLMVNIAGVNSANRLAENCIPRR